MAGFDVAMCVLCHIQVWAVSGEPRGSSGGRREFTPLKWVMQEVTPQTPPTRRSAQVTLPLWFLGIGSGIPSDYEELNQ